MSPTIRLLCLVQKPRGIAPGQRFRLEQWAPILQAQHGIDLNFSPFESAELTRVLYQPGQQLHKARCLVQDTLRRRFDLLRAPAYDGVVIYREAASLGPAIYERLIARRGLPIFYDFDDAIWIPVVGSQNGAFSRLRFQGKTRTICRLARAVCVGNEVLAAWARRYSQAVHVVPTSIDLTRYPLQPERPLGPREPLVLLWSGSQSTLPYLDALRPALAQLGRERPVLLKIVANAPPREPFAGVQNQYLPWSEDGEAAVIGDAHVGLMPLPDDEFARGKCGLKALQYMACGLPVVLSPVGVNCEIVQHGRSGLWARSTIDWVESLRTLGEAPELRRRFREAGRATVEAGYSAERSAERFAAVVRGSLTPPLGKHPHPALQPSHATS